MNSIDMLLTRRSQGALTTPAPSDQQLNTILKAGSNVPDHACLMPWHFTVLNNEQALSKLSVIFEHAAIEQGADEFKVAKASKMPFRSPLIIIVSTRYSDHEKVPKNEQLIAAGCAVHAMQMAAFSLGYGAIWRTGDFSYNDSIKNKLNIELSEDLVGYLYIGTPSKAVNSKPEKDLASFVSYF